MTGTPLVVLDACVLANFSLCDTLLRLAEPPRLFEPKWSEEIIRETARTLELKLGWPNSLTAHLEEELRAHFRDAWISGYESLIPRMANDEEDGHVVAAAVDGSCDHLDPQPLPLQARARPKVARHLPIPRLPASLTCFSKPLVERGFWSFFCTPCGVFDCRCGDVVAVEEVPWATANTQRLKPICSS